ncbi:MAG TPA: hypothetical protein VGQ58_03675 [Candidatus Limnocylindrales bacterium]|jgi:hypothetical protein|nr:hypothetical protein [Candidatus Limnocylindrales bacterium]
MQVISSRRSSHGGLISVLIGTTVGAILLLGGLLVGFLTFGTPFISSFTPSGRPETAEVVAGMLAWTFALIAPSVFVIVGLARIITVLDAITASRPRPTPASRLARVLSDDYVAASRLRLPDGRAVPELVVGPFGVAMLAELPPAAATRHKGHAWEVRTSAGQWIPFENPLDRASRDAERVRSWFATDDQDFLVKVYAAVVAPDTTIERTSTCAVIAPQQIPAWLASLPVQRSLTAARRERIIELIRETA